LTSAAASHLPADAETVKLRLAVDILRSGSSVQIRAWGNSMLPSIWPGDLLTIRSCQPSEIVVGDILCFVRSGRFVIHRIAEIQCVHAGRLWVTRGDCMVRTDEPVTDEQILGKVVTIQRNGRVLSPAPRLSRLGYCLGRLLDISIFQSLAFRFLKMPGSRPGGQSKLEMLSG
jgi:signal peptidase I